MLMIINSAAGVSLLFVLFSKLQLGEMLTSEKMIEKFAL